MNVMLSIRHAKQIAPASTPTGLLYATVTLVIFSKEDLIFVSTLMNVHLEHTNATKMPNVATMQVDITALARKVSRVTVSTVSILMNVN